MRRLSFLLLLLAACPSEPARTNPFDPSAAPDLQAKATIRGTLVLQCSSELSNVDVRLRQQGRIAQRTVTAADGAFLFDGLVPGPFLVESSPPGYAPLSVGVEVEPGEDLDLGELSLTALSAASAIEGVVTLEGGGDHGGTLVETVGRPYTTVTTSSGAFRLQVTEGTFTLRFVHADFVTEELRDLVVTSGQTFQVEPFALRTNPATVTGHVDAELVAGGSAALADATVTLDGTAVTGLTNAAGDFALTGVPAGSYLLRVVKEGWLAQSVPVLNLTGGELRALSAPLFLELSRGALQGSVSLSDTSDASGVLVEVVGTSRATVTGADGRYLFTGLLADADGYEVSLRRDGYARRSVTSAPVLAGQTAAVPAVVLGRQGGAVTVSEGPYVNAREVTLTLAAANAVYYRASEDPDFADPALGDAGESWRPYPAGQSAPFTLSDADGEHTIWVAFSDGTTASTPASASVVLDRQAPGSPSVTIGDGGGYTRAVGGVVTLSLSALDLPALAGAAVSGIDRMELAHDPGFAGATRVDYQLTTTWALASPSVQGEKAVWVRFLDRAGNVSAPAGATVILDTEAPADPAISLLGAPPAPAGYSASTLVTATLDASDANQGAGKANLLVRLSNTACFVCARYQPFAGTQAWVLAPGDGPKTVWAQFMDPAGNESLPVSAGLILDATAPLAPVVGLVEQDSRPTNGYTNKLTVGVSISAGGSPAAAQLSEDPSFGTGVQSVAMAGQPQPVSTQFTLGGSGLRTVWVLVVDEAGNSSPVSIASVTVDTQPPAAIAPVYQPSPVTASAAIRLVPPSAGQDELRLTGNVVSPSGWVAAAPDLPIDVALSAGDGQKSLTLTWRDLADNQTALPAATLWLDGQAPTVAAGFTVKGTLGDGTAGTTLTATTGVTLDLSAVASDATTQVAQVMLSNLPSFADASWQPFVASSALPWTLPPGDGAKTVWAKFKDAAGNVSAPVSGSISLLATPPSGGSIAIESGAAATNKSTVSLALAATGASEMQLLINGAASGGWIPYATTASVPLAAPEGNKTIAARFRNAARVEGGGASSSILFDATAPAAPTLLLTGTIGNGQGSTNWAARNTVLAEVGSTGDAVEMAFLQGAICRFASPPSLWMPLSASTTLVLSGADGTKTVCVWLRDRAGNAGPVASDTIELDTTAPTAPTFADLVSTTTNATSVTGHLVAASTDPAPGSTPSYECLASPASTAWTSCAPGAGLSLSFNLSLNRPNLLGVRARDEAFNYSEPAQVSMVQDAIAPFPPNVTGLRTTRDALTVEWTPSSDTDVSSFLVYYGNAAGDLAGSGAAQGPSPLQVAAVGDRTHTYTLTGLTPAQPYYVAVEAIDRAGNRSGPSGQRSAVPNKVNPRMLSSIGGQPQAVATIIEGTKVFAYLTENQAIVQLDVTSDTLAPIPVGRAMLPGMVPDPGAPPAIQRCSKQVGQTTIAGHCVMVAGSTLEGDFREDPDRYRAPTPVVFFPLDGSVASPALGTVESVLPARAHRVFAEVIDGDPAVVALELGRVVAFDLARLAFPKKVAEEALPSGLETILDATVIGNVLYFYANSRMPGWEIPYPAGLFSVQLDNLWSSELTVTNHGSLLDHLGNTLGDDPSHGGLVPRPVFRGGIYIAYEADDYQLWLCSYPLPSGSGAPPPAQCLMAHEDPETDEIIALAGGNGHLYLFGATGFSGPYVQQINASGTTLSLGGFLDNLPDVNGAAVAYYGGKEHLLVIERDNTSPSYGLGRYTVVGTTITHLTKPYLEIAPEWFAVKDHQLFAAQGSSINSIDFSNPLNPRAVARVTRTYNDYGKLVVHGRHLFASTRNSVSGNGVEIFRINSDGTLTYRNRVATGAVVNDLVVVGKTLLVARADGFSSLAAWNIANPAAPVAAGAFNATGAVFAFDARPASSGGVGYSAVVYAALINELRTFGYQASTSTFTALSSAVSLPNSYDQPPNAVSVAGTTAIVSFASHSEVQAPEAGVVAANVTSPSSPYLLSTGGLLPLSGPVIQQGGYAVGLAPAGAPNGPVFVTFSGGSSSANGAVDGGLLYSTCADRTGAGSLAHANGVYYASCRRNGIVAFAVTDPGGGRLLKRHDIAGDWTWDSAAMAGDGTFHALGGMVFAGDPSRLYSVGEMANTGLTPSAPAFLANIGGTPNSRYARWMLHNDGLAWTFTRNQGTYTNGIEAYETAYPYSTWPSRASVTLSTAGMNAEPVTDGEFAYVPRTSGLNSTLEVYDLRDPAALTATPTASLSVTGQITALGLGRERLYVGRLNTPTVLVYTVQGTSLTLRSTAIAAMSSTDQLTGIAVAGPYFFYTFKAQAPNVWGLGVVKMNPTSLDGVGASSVGYYLTTLPLANPIVSGDTLFTSNNLGVATFDLTPLWKRGEMPVALAGTTNVDALRSGPVKLTIEGPFGYLVGGSYRAFDLR